MDTPEDFIRKYQHTFVFLDKDTQLENLFEFQQIQDERRGHLVFNNPTVGNVLLSLENQERVKIKFPDPGCYNFAASGHTGFFNRMPERQWKRALCTQNSKVSYPFTAAVRWGGYDWATLQDIFFPHYYSVQEAINVLNHRTSSIGNSMALSKLFTVVKGKDTLYLAAGKSLIGFVGPEKIVVEYPPLVQEAKDFFGENLVWKT